MKTPNTEKVCDRFYNLETQCPNCPIKAQCVATPQYKEHPNDWEERWEEQIEKAATEYLNTVQTCPLCGKTYTERPAISRSDNKTLICPECGTREALKSCGIPIDVQDAIIAEINKVKEEHMS